MGDLRIAVIGAGVIGRTHIETIRQTSGFALAGIVEPSDQGARLARELGCQNFAGLEEVIADRPDGAILATPNALHVPMGIDLLAAGIPVLIEKPIAETTAAAQRLLDEGGKSGTPALVGHHRRHNPIIKAAKARIEAGDFGTLVMANVSSSLMKPNSYFDLAWRREPGNGGPLLINMIHEVDLLRHFFGDISAVMAVASSARRDLPVEDTAAVLLEQASGGLVAAALSDAANGPWAWDLTSGENPGRFPAHPVSSHSFSGTRAGFSLPDLTWWQHKGTPDWTRPMTRSKLRHGHQNTYNEQLRHFGQVIRGKADPMVTLRDGIENLRVIEAMKQSAASGARVMLDGAR